MKRIDTATAVPDKFGIGKKGFTNGDVIGGIAATDLDEDWFDDVQEEIANVIEGAGIALDGADKTQLLQAVQALAVVPDASTSVKGKVQLASGAEAAAGTDALKALTPATLRSGLNATGSAPLYGCRAFVNWSALGGTVTVRSSGNVSSVTRNSLGDFTINFATAMPDANYCPSFAGYWDLTYRCTMVISPAALPTASALRVETWTHLGGVHDFAFNNVTIHR